MDQGEDAKRGTLKLRQMDRLRDFSPLGVGEGMQEVTLAKH